MTFLSLLARTFVTPLRNWRRTLIYAGIFLGVMGFGLLNMVSAYDFASGSSLDLIAYFAALHLPLCFLLAPSLYIGFTIFEGRGWRFTIFLLQVAALGLFLTVPHMPIYQGLAGAFLSAPFWTAYHIGMVQNTSDGETGFEVSMAGLFAMVGGIIALGIGGVTLTDSAGHLGAIIALSCLLAGTACMLLASRVRARGTLLEFFASAQRIARENRFLTLQVAMLGLFDVPAYALLALMREVQFVPALATALLVTRALANFLLAPWLGKTANNLSSHAVRYGFGFVFIGWGILLASGYYSLAFIPALLIYGFGQRLVGGVVDVSWYRMRNYASMALHEIFLGVGRALAFVLFLPLLKVNVSWYAATIMATCLACLLLNYVLGKKSLLPDKIS